MEYIEVIRKFLLKIVKKETFKSEGKQKENNKKTLY